MVSRERKSPFIHINDKANVHHGIVCEPFHVMSYYIGCIYNCSYCYLQGTFRGMVHPVIYSNREKMLQELDKWLTLPGSLRLNAGELNDSLALDGKIPLVEDLVTRFASQDRHKLILVTKSTNVKNLLRYNPQGQVIVSFSINSESAWRKFEHKTPHPFKRVEAAAMVKEAGYLTVLRLDPMFPLPAWKTEYQKLVELVFSHFTPDQFTLGSLRYFPTVPAWAGKLGRSTEVYNYGRERSPEDGRYRINRSARQELYEWAIKVISAHGLGLPIRLCKETEAMHRMLNLPCRGCCYNTKFKGNGGGR